jgi:hypothetical protein
MYMFMKFVNHIPSPSSPLFTTPLLQVPPHTMYWFCIYLHVYTLFDTPHLQTDPILPSHSQFCRLKIIKDKKNIVFLLVCDKHSYIGRFLVMFPSIHILSPKLVPLHQIYSLLPSPIPIVAPAYWRLLHSFLYSEHINHIQVFGLLPIPYPSNV